MFEPDRPNETPSTLVALIITSAPISMARRLAAESVVKKGISGASRKDHDATGCRCRTASLRLQYSHT